MTRKRLLTATCALLLACPAGAQVCEITETLTECEGKLRQAHDTKLQQQQMQKEELRARAEADTVTGVARSETGVETAGANLATNVKDFLPILAATGLLGTKTDTDESMGTFTVDLNFILPGELKERNGQLQLVLNTDAGLYEPLKMALEAENGDDESDPAQQLSDDISGIGEYSVNFSINWRGERLGRYFGAHRLLFSNLVTAVEPTPEMPDVVLTFTNLQPDDNDCPNTQGDCTFEQAAKGDTRLATDLRDALERIVLEDLDLSSILAEGMVDVGLDHYSALVDNQPQLHFAASYVGRDTEVGPDNWSVSATYEHPMAPNVNRLRRSFRERGLEDACRKTRTLITARERTDCANAYSAFFEGDLDGDGEAEKDNMTASLSNADRLTFSIQYVDRESLSIPVPGESEPRTFGSSRELIGKLGWGRVLELNDDGTTKTRVDLLGSYEDVSNDPMRNDRGLVTLTVTRDFGAYSIPLGIVWSNKPEFLTMQDPDEQISAHVGLKYSIDKKENGSD